MNIQAYLGAVKRQVVSRERGGNTTHAVILRREFDASVHELWDAVSKPKRLRSFFLPVSGDLRAGGTFQFEGHAGGTISVCEPPQCIEATWESGGSVSWLVLTLADTGAGHTLLTLDHTAPVGDKTWAEYGPGATGVGWDMLLMGLAQYLTEEPEVYPENSAAWSASSEGRQFVRDSSDAWCQADIASGTDEAAAREAAARTAAAYTGAE